MPTWTAPRLPPPARTKAVRCGRGGRPAAARRRRAQRPRRRSDSRRSPHRRPRKERPHIGCCRVVHARGRRGGPLCGSACGVRSCWRARHAVRPAMSWRTAHMIDEDSEHDHGDHEDPEDHVEGGAAADAAEDRGRCHGTRQGRGLSHPRATLPECSSSPRRRRHRPSLPRGGMPRCGPSPTPATRSSGACAGRSATDPSSTPVWPAACGPGSRTPPTMPWRDGGRRSPRSSSVHAVCSGWPPRLAGMERRPRHPGTIPARPNADLLPSLVRALFRQLVYAGRIADALPDALDGLRGRRSRGDGRAGRGPGPLRTRPPLAGSLASHAAT